MEGNMVSYMGSLVYDWLLSAGDKKLAEKFKKEAKPEPLPPNSPRLADFVKHYKETTPQKRKAEPAVNGNAKKANFNMFGDLKTPAGVKALDSFLADHSYIEGYVPSQADTQVYEALGSAPKDAHALRWYNHIKSFGTGMKQFPKASSGFSLGGGAAPAAADDDDDVDLFGSSDEEESEEKKRITEERLKAYHEKKSKKAAVIAKTSVLLDVKPWDDETDMDKMLENVKSIEQDGLLWGASKLIPIGYGIKKLQVMCTVEDEKVSIEELCEKIEEFEDFVQSCDVNAMNKI